MTRVYLAGRLRDYPTARAWRQEAALLLSEHNISAVSPVYAPWEGDAPPALTPRAVEWPDLEELRSCRYILVAGGAGSGTGFALGYAFARRENNEPGPAQVVWITDSGPPPPFIRLWEPACVSTIQEAVAWIAAQEAVTNTGS
ncbi:MAG TPA: hypothetical protein VFJ58_04035 [Armatimonadota bacterium]|nr:hypothetical protein [Armatimonadota bacterium]